MGGLGGIGRLDPKRKLALSHSKLSAGETAVDLVIIALADEEDFEGVAGDAIDDAVLTDVGAAVSLTGAFEQAGIRRLGVLAETQDFEQYLLRVLVREFLDEIPGIA